MTTEFTTIGIKADSTPVVDLDKALDDLAETGDKAEKSTDNLNDSLEDNEKKSKKSTKATSLLNKEIGSLSTLAAGAGAATAAAFTAIGVASVAVFADLEERLIGVQKTTNFTNKEMELFSDNIDDMSRRVPVSTAALLDIAGVAGQLGVKGVKDVSAFTETVAKLSLATDIVGEEGAASIARLLTVSGEGMEAVDMFGAVLVRLGNNSAATESQILSMATEVGQATAPFTVASTESLAMAAALKSLGISSELGGSVVGRAMRSIESAIESGGTELENLARVSGIAAEDLKEAFGTNATAVFHQWVQGVGDMIEQGNSASSVLGAFGLSGEEVLKVLPTLAVNSDVLTRSLEMQNDELTKGTALNDEAAKAGEALSAQWQLGKNIMSEYAFTIGKGIAPSLKDMLEAAQAWHEVNGDLLKQEIGEWMERISVAAAFIADGILAIDNVSSWVFGEVALGFEWMSNQGSVAALTIKTSFTRALDDIAEAYAVDIEQIGKKLSGIPLIGEDIALNYKIAADSLRKSSTATEDYEADLAALNATYAANIKAIKKTQEETVNQDLITRRSGQTHTEIADKIAEENKKLTDQQLQNNSDLREDNDDTTNHRLDNLEFETGETALAIEEQLQLKEWLEEETNKLTKSEFDYKLDKLDQEVEKMEEVAGDDMALQDQIAAYHELKQAEIFANFDENARKKEERAKETERIMSELVGAGVQAVIKGENAKVAVASKASDILADYATKAATKGLTQIFEGLGAQIGAWAGLGTAQSATDGDTWQQKVASGLLYVGGAAAAIMAGRAVGDSFHAEGGWINRNPSGGMVREGSGIYDDVFAGSTRRPDGGRNDNWIMGGEFVVNRKQTQKHRGLLEDINADNVNLAEGGPIVDAWGPTRDLNDAGFDVFVDSVIESKGNWKKAILDGVLFYGGTLAGMTAGKEIGKRMFAGGGEITYSQYGLGDLLDPLGIGDKVPGLPGGGGMGGIDWGGLWDWLRSVDLIGPTIERADKILYPWVRDTLTPGVFPGSQTVEDSLEGMYTGLADEIIEQLTYSSLNPLNFAQGGVLGSYKTGTDYVPQTGPYLLHQGEKVTPADKNDDSARMVELLASLNMTVSQLGALIEDNTRKTARIMESFNNDGIPTTRGF